jgi:hypothetical protein
MASFYEILKYFLITGNLSCLYVHVKNVIYLASNDQNDVFF